MTYERILVAVGASDDDRRLLRRVVDVINVNGAHIDLLHVAGHPVTAYGDDSGHHVAPGRQLREDRYAVVKALADAFAIPAGRVHIEFGDTIEVLERFAAQHHCGLLVVGNHVGGVAGNVGRLAAGLLKECRCDVLVVNL